MYRHLTSNNIGVRVSGRIVEVEGEKESNHQYLWPLK